MSTLKVDTINTTDGSGNITFSRPTVLQAGDIVTADIADNAITLAKMAGGTDGQVITYDASGDPVAVGPGTDGQVLTSTGAGSPPAFEAAGGGAWNFIGTNEFSAVTSVTITGLDSTYDTYAFIGSNISCVTDNTNVAIRIGDSGGVDSGSTDYAYHGSQSYSNANTYSGFNSPGADYMWYNNSVGAPVGSSGKGFGFMLYLHNQAGIVRPMLSGTHVTIDNSGITKGGQAVGSRLIPVTVDRVQLYDRSSTNMSGRFSVYGLANS